MSEIMGSELSAWPKQDHNEHQLLLLLLCVCGGGGLFVLFLFLFLKLDFLLGGRSSGGTIWIF